MHRVGLKTLKSKLSEYVRLAASGETVVVTDRNRVVAEINSPHTKQLLTDAEFLAQGVREGWITPATGRSGKPPMRLAVASFDEIMRELDQDREDR